MSLREDSYNAVEYANERLKPIHVAELLRRAGRSSECPDDLKPRQVTNLVVQFQAANGLVVDGMAGPTTRALIELLKGRLTGPEPEVVPLADITISKDGWLSGTGVEVMPIHRSWYYPRLATVDGKPAAIVAHYSATPYGTARNMAKNRAAALTTTDREASWHISIEGDGSIVQMAPTLVGCWHAGGATAKPIAGVGPANRVSVGVELIGYGDAFPAEQVNSAKRVWRALVRAYAIPRDRAMIGHSQIDPTRKRDPGPIWTKDHAPGVLEFAYT